MTGPHVGNPEAEPAAGNPPPTDPAAGLRAQAPLTAAVAAAVALVLALNRPGPVPTAPPPDEPAAGSAGGTGLVRHEIGPEVGRHGVTVTAAWHRAVAVDGREPAGPGWVHLAAEVRAAAGNPQGFGPGERVPYLTVRYALAPRDGSGKAGPARAGVLRPVLAGGGPHYGVDLPDLPPGDYRLTLSVEPPTAAAVSRLTDPAAGAAPWWPAFEAEFGWTYRP